MGANADMSEIVVLVDEDDREIGTAGKIEAHLGGGRLHRAFSVFLIDDQGRVMLQKRARSKYHFGGLWANTCCSHPRPGEDVVAAGQRRLTEELGLRADLERVTSFIYRATDEASGLTEHELDHVLIGRVHGTPAPNPDEVADWKLMTPAEIDRELAESPETYTPWFPIAWRTLSASRHARRPG